MAHNQTTLGIDHPLVTVADHAATLDRYRRMGFQPSPVSHHPWGTVTALVMFPDNFIELIGVEDPSKFGTNSVNGFCFGRFLGGFLDNQEGVSLVALHSKDARADHRAVVEKGLKTQGIIDFRRAMKKPDGTPDEAVVSLVMLIDEDLPEASNFICHQHRPELIWVPEWQNHPNGAVAIAAVTYVDDAAGTLAKRFATLYGTDGEGGVFDTGCGVINVVAAREAAGRFGGVDLPRFAADRPHAVAITVAVESLRQLRASLEAGEVPHTDAERRVLVAPDFCGNVILEFVERTS
ncbi:VOC family protein [Kaustia mangrovi]|uniref:VOC family protein n=1 Tax=Kaustia mangrovi TaxID=2593653 RepID=A0A7S8C6N9_9HYPH|nr:VOC family protein [Kaustia mangrovi]QPC44393.1 VOC family protein [Kaustia mangrovi]